MTNSKLMAMKSCIWKARFCNRAVIQLKKASQHVSAAGVLMLRNEYMFEARQWQALINTHGKGM